MFDKARKIPISYIMPSDEKAPPMQDRS